MVIDNTRSSLSRRVKSIDASCVWSYAAIRIDFSNRIAQVLFTVEAGEAVLLHGFVKQSRKTPLPDLKTARKRKALLK